MMPDPLMNAAHHTYRSVTIADPRDPITFKGIICGTTIRTPRDYQERHMQLTVNGTTHEVDVDPDTPLLWVIREELGLTGTKYGCGVAACGACTVLVDGEPTRSCVTPAEVVAGQTITTIETVEEIETGRRVVQAWVDQQVPQCGYCQSGQVLAATALLTSNPEPTDQDIDDSMTNLCRCGTYNKMSYPPKFGH